MLLTAEQLQEIRQIIVDHHNAFAVNQYGPAAVAPDILAALKEKGLVEVELNTLTDAYVYGRVLAILGEPKAAQMTYPQFRAYVKTNPQPLSSQEQHAVTVAASQAGALCQGLGNKLDKATGQLLIEADANLRQTFKRTIRTKTAENIARRQSIANLKSEIGHATGDWTRDLNRIAVTETQNAMQQGMAAAIEEDHGADALVAKRVAPGCCDICVKLYTGSDGQPRIFSLAALQAQGTNQGRKAAESRPVVGPVHPNCHPPGTMVTTSLGPRSIEHVYPGEYVWTHKQRLRRVTHVWCQEYHGDMVELELGWRTLRATPNHPLYNGTTFVPAGEFAAGDTLMRDDSNPDAEPGEIGRLDFAGQTQMLHGQGPDSPFLALVFTDGVFMHEGFVYQRDRLADGPLLPSLKGRLRFTRLGALSIAGGDALVLNDHQWVDDACENLVFRRVGKHMADELRLRCVPGPFARLLENWAQPIPAYPEALGNGVQAKALGKMQRQNSRRVERRMAGTAHAGAAACGQGGGHHLAAAAQHGGDSGDGHGFVMEQAGDRFGVQVEPIAPPGLESPGPQQSGQLGGAATDLGSYLVEGMVVIEMAARHDVYVDLAAKAVTPPMHVTHGKAVAQKATVSKASIKRYHGAVYNLTVEEDETYVADGYISHNCRCQLVAVPKGGGFNAKGQMAMGGSFGIRTNPATLEEQLAHKSMLQKAMGHSHNAVAAFGLPLDVHVWAPAAQHGRWLAKATIPHLSLQLPVVVGPSGTAAEAYVVHGHNAPDHIALGFEAAIDAALAYQAAHPQGRIATMEALPLAEFVSYVQAAEARAQVLQPAPPPQERLVLSQNPFDAGMRVGPEYVGVRTDASVNTDLGSTGAPSKLPKPPRPKTRQDIGGLMEAMHDPAGYEQSTKRVFDREAADLYRNTPNMVFHKPDLVAPVVPPKDLKLIIKRNRTDLDRRTADSRAGNAILNVGAKHAAEFFGLAGNSKEQPAAATKPKAKRKAKAKRSKAAPKREPVK